MTENKKNLCRKLYLTAAVSFAVLYSIYCFIISPSYYSVIYNVAYEGTAVPDILKYLGGIVEVIAQSVFYAALGYGMYRLGYKKCRGFILLFVLSNLYKYTCNVIMTWVDGGSVPLQWYFDMLNVVFYSAMEMITFMIIWFIIKKQTEDYRARAAVLAKVGKSERVFPFVGVYKRKNCLMNSALFYALTVLVLKLFGQLVQDLATVKEITNLPLMLLSYSSNVIFAVLSYFAMMFALITINDKLEKIIC